MPYLDLRRLRQDNGNMKQQELAEKLGCEQSHISQMESGKRNISDEMLSRVEDIFGDITRYIVEAPEKSVIQQTQNGDNIGRDVNFFSSSDEKDKEIMRLNILLEASRNEIAWLRGMVEKLTSK